MAARNGRRHAHYLPSPSRSQVSLLPGHDGLTGLLLVACLPRKSAAR